MHSKLYSQARLSICVLALFSSFVSAWQRRHYTTYTSPYLIFVYRLPIGSHKMKCAVRPLYTTYTRVSVCVCVYVRISLLQRRQNFFHLIFPTFFFLPLTQVYLPRREFSSLLVIIQRLVINVFLRACAFFFFFCNTCALENFKVKPSPYTSIR